MRTIIGYQRFQQLPQPPWPIAYILDKALLPAYFGKGFDAIKKFIHVLPAVRSRSEPLPRNRHVTVQPPPACDAPPVLDALPQLGDIIHETWLLHAFLASTLRSAKALILFASAAKAIRVRRRLRREAAARRIGATWRRHVHRRSSSDAARRHVARLRWQHAAACWEVAGAGGGGGTTPLSPSPNNGSPQKAEQKTVHRQRTRSVR